MMPRLISRILAGSGRIALLNGILLLAAGEMPAQSPVPAFQGFVERVRQYVTSQRPVRHLRTTNRRKQIVERRAELVRRIRETRATAQQGDIFTPVLADEFRQVIRSAFQGPNAINVRNTVRRGDPQPGWVISINGSYPDDLPLTTVPPSLLLRLPQLPPEVAYRIMGHDFVLQDTEARLVIDYIPAAIPTVTRAPLRSGHAQH